MQNACGYHCIDAARPLPKETDMHSNKLTNHEGLVLVYRDGIKIVKKLVSAAVTSFEYLFVYATISNSIFVLL